MMGSMKPIIVWSNGGGVQSTAIAVLILQERLPRPDYIVMADTGREMQTTWEYMERYTRPALDAIGLPIHIVGGGQPDLYSGKTLLIPAQQVRPNGKVGKLRTFCSRHWKVDQVRHWMRKDMQFKIVDQWLGISKDEVERMAYTDLGWLENVYPLIDLVPMTRDDCVRLVREYGWPDPPKSRCYMCPNQTPGMWREMAAEQPDEFAKAVAMEERLRQDNDALRLHARGIPLLEIADVAGDDPFDGCDGGHCFV